MSIDVETGKTRIEPQKKGPKGKNAGMETFTNARSAPGGENAPQPLINPDDPYNRMSGAGSGDKGTTLMGSGTTAVETTPKKIEGDVAHPPTDAFNPDTSDLHPAGDTKTTTADDLIDASDAVAAGHSHPVETEDFARLQDAQIPSSRIRGLKRSGSPKTSISGTAEVGSTITARIGGVDPLVDKVWLRVKGPDRDYRTRAAHEGDSASQAVLITRPGRWEISFEVNTKIVGEQVFDVV